MTLGFIEKKMTAFFPKVDERKSKAQVGADEEDSGPAAIAAGAQEDVKGGKGNGKGKNNAKETGGGGGENRWKNTVCFVCGKTGHSYRGVRDNGKPWHKLEDIEAARAKEGRVASAYMRRERRVRSQLVEAAQVKTAHISYIRSSRPQTLVA